MAKQRVSLGLSVDELSAISGMSPRQVMAVEAISGQESITPDTQRMLRLYARKVGLPDVMSNEPKPPVSANPTMLCPVPPFLLKQPSVTVDG